MSAQVVVRDNGGLARVGLVRRRGWSERAIRRAVEAGEVSRRLSWLRLPMLRR